MKIVALMCLVGAASAGTVARSRAPTRDEKLFSVFQIVKFNNDVCTASDGNMGTCYTASECTANGGTANGNCASGFGVCCTATVDTCSSTGSTIKMNNTYIANAGYPNTISTGSSSCSTSRQTTTTTTTTYTYTIEKPSTDISQIRLEFLDFEIDSPSSGSCANSTLSITGTDSVTSKVLPSNLCGVLTGQHLYLSVADVTSVTLKITLNSVGTQKWNILVRFFDSTQTDYLAPRGCLQYHRASSGQIQTMNYNSGNGELLTDHMYTACIAQVTGYCDVSLVASSFALGGTSGSCTSTDDKLVLGASTYCGTTFGTSNTLTWSYSGSYMMNIMTGTTNAAMNAGFGLNYLLLPC